MGKQRAHIHLSSHISKACIYLLQRQMQSSHLEQNNSMQHYRLRAKWLSSSFGAEPVTPGGQQTELDSAACHLQHWKLTASWAELARALQADQGKWLFSFIWHSRYYSWSTVSSFEPLKTRQMTNCRETSWGPTKIVRGLDYCILEE